MKKPRDIVSKEHADIHIQGYDWTIKINQRWDCYQGGFGDGYYYALSLCEPLAEELERFANIEAGDGDDFSGLNDDVIIRVEVTAGDLKAARQALAEYKKRIGENE